MPWELAKMVKNCKHATEPVGNWGYASEDSLYKIYIYIYQRSFKKTAVKKTNLKIDAQHNKKR